MYWLKKYKSGLGILFCILCTSFSAVAQSNTHSVKAGETLYSIANQYDLSVQQLKDWNNLQTNRLSIGQTLIVRREEVSDTLVHTVKPRETLFSISKMYDVTIPEIRSWNNLSGNNLEIGQKLTIYQNETSQQDKSSGTHSIVADESYGNNTYYTVKSGDTLYRIAREHNMTVHELKDLNDLTSDNIAIGQQLTVKMISAPPSVTRSMEDSSPQGKFVSYQPKNDQPLNEILKKFQMTKTEFYALNPDFSGTHVEGNQQITVLLPSSRTFENPYLTKATLKGLGKTEVSTYSNSNVGKTTTSGELYNPDDLTAAHSNIAMGTVIYIQNPANHKGVYVRINDRLSGKGLKLSKAAWQALNFSSPNPTVKMFQDQ